MYLFPKDMLTLFLGKLCYGLGIIMESIEHRGLWWLPDKPAETVGGILSFSQQEGGKLELIGAFNSAFEQAQGNHSIILGVTTGGKLVTLQKCLETSRSI